MDASADAFLDEVKEFDIAVDVRPMGRQWIEARYLVRRYHLSAYDAAYLSLAKGLDVALATLDETLRRAATSEAVSLLI